MQVCHYSITILISTFPFGWLLGGMITPVCRRGIPMGPGPLETDLYVLNLDGRL